MTELVKVTGVNVFTDKDGIEYKQLVIKGSDIGFIQLPTGEWKQIKQLSRENRINVWPAHERNGMTFRADEAYALELNDEVAGRIVTREVAEYDIIDRISGETRKATRYSTVVFGNTENKEEFEAKTKAAFARQGHDLDSVFNAMGVKATERVQTVATEEVKSNAAMA